MHPEVGAFYLFFRVDGFFRDDIAAVAAAGITRGCAVDLFCPDDVVTRGQMAAFINRALDLPDGPPTGFWDEPGIFAADIRALAAAGITNGCTAFLFCTDQPVTRGQMAAFLHRALVG